ncbi:MAG: hypothetical protein U0132_24015 [Gemmatimonadaceae bacterium]
MNALAMMGGTSATIGAWPGVYRGSALYGDSALMICDVSAIPDTVSEATPARVIELLSVTGWALRIEFDTEPPLWLLRLVERAKALLELPEGWNGHAAAAVPIQAATTMLMMTVQTLTEASPSPTITPLSDGGIQLEWHEPDMEIEVVIDAQGLAHVWYDDSREGVEDEFTESGDFPRFHELAAELTRRV